MLGSLFSKKDKPIKTYNDFWDWFVTREGEFYEVVKNHDDVYNNFLKIIGKKLGEIKEETFFYLTGKFDENRAELILSAESNIINIVFVEELHAAAPVLPNWKFSCLKAGRDFEGECIEMNDYSFDTSNSFFYSVDDSDYPDSIDIVVTHDSLRDAENDNNIKHGFYILLDNLIGELSYIEDLDSIEFLEKENGEKEWIPIHKLNDFILWRKKEYVEKYEGRRYDTENDTYATLEATLESGSQSVAMLNTSVIMWDALASHPWISIITMHYDGSETNGFPNDIDYNKLNEIEEELLEQLKDNEGHINIGRETSDDKRTIYFASFDFRLPSKVFYEHKNKYLDEFNFEFEIYKDKYWRTFDWVRRSMQPE